jgi:hypothetical protein
VKINEEESWKQEVWKKPVNAVSPTRPRRSDILSSLNVQLCWHVQLCEDFRFKSMDYRCHSPCVSKRRCDLYRVVLKNVRILYLSDGDILLCARTRIYSEIKITANSVRLSTLVSLFFLVPCRLGLEQLQLRTDINLFFAPVDRHQPISILPVNVTRLRCHMRAHAPRNRTCLNETCLCCFEINPLNSSARKLPRTQPFTLQWSSSPSSLWPWLVQFPRRPPAKLY